MLVSVSGRPRVGIGRNWLEGNVLGGRANAASEDLCLNRLGINQKLSQKPITPRRVDQPVGTTSTRRQVE